MTIALLTHPRSGSTKLIKCLCNSLSINKDVKNLGEFFQITNSKNFGNLYPITTSKKIDTKIVDISDIKDHLKDKRLSDITDFNSYIKNELLNRVLFMQKLNDLNIDHVFKYFFYHRPNKNVYNDLYAFLEKSYVQKIVLYRRNLLSSIFSHLIKEKIINQNYSKNDYDHFRLAGHNYGDTMPLKPIKPLYVSFTQFKSDTDIFFNFYSYMTEHLDLEILEYEKLYSKNFNEIEIGDVSIKIDMSTDPEIPMEYAEDKSKFFSNSEDFPKFILKILTERQLIDVSEKLNLIYDFT